MFRRVPCGFLLRSAKPPTSSSRRGDDDLVMNSDDYTPGFLGRALDKILSSSKTAAGAKGAAQEATKKLKEMAGEDERSPEEQKLAMLSETTHIPRSVLFVPCNNERAMQKVPKLPADTFILDLEDAVAPRQKMEARDRMVDVIQSGQLDGCRIVVRINSVRTTPQWGFADLDACGVVAEKIHAIAIPKVSPMDFELMKPQLHPEQKLWAFFETPKSILQAQEICESGRYEMGVMGTNDLSAELQLPLMTPPKNKDSGESAEKESTQDDFANSVSRRFGMLASMSHVVNCCRAFNMGVIDGVFNDPTDRPGLLRECHEGRLLGFDGKTLIHPDQLSTCNNIFTPQPHEVEWAEKIIGAMADAPPESQGGVIVVEGRMVEELHARRARAILVRAGQTERLKQLEEQQKKDARRREEEEQGGEQRLGSKSARGLHRKAQNWDHVNQPGCYYDDGSTKFKL